MSFTSKNIQHSSRSGITFLKGATRFFLGMSCVLFLTHGFEITPSVRNARQYIQKIIFTQDGYSTSNQTIIIDGASGNASFAGTVTGAVFCLEGDSCITERPEGGTVVGGESIWSTGADDEAYYIAGNVGIGTDEPTEKFQVGEFAQIGDGAANSTGGKFLRLVGRTYDDFQVPQVPSNIQLNNIHRAITNVFSYRNRKIENDNSLKFDYATGSYDYDTKLSLSSAGLMTLDGNIRLETGGLIYATPNSSSNQLYLDNNGRVGIGTNDLTANNKLHISTNVPEIMKITNTAASKSRGFAISGGGRFSIYEVDGVDNPERLSIATGGKVGIGTSSTSSKLHVKNDGTTSNIITFERSGYTNRNFGIYTNGRFMLTESGNEYLSITNAGLVGINKTSPSFVLDISGSQADMMRLLGPSSTEMNIGLAGNGDINIENETMSGGNINFMTRRNDGNPNPNHLYLQGTTGYVGIGTTTLTEKLTVNGGIAASSGIVTNGGIKIANSYGDIGDGSGCVSTLEGTMIYKRTTNGPVTLGLVYMCAYVNGNYERQSLSY